MVFVIRNYYRKYDMDEPPKLEEPLDESDSRVKRLKEQDGATNRDEYNLEERFYRYGVRPEWLVVHRVINHRLQRDGRATYLVKWRELGYDQATWEDEHEDIPGLKQAIEYYLDLRAANWPRRRKFIRDSISLATQSTLCSCKRNEMQSR